jgi:adenosine deaminase
MARHFLVDPHVHLYGAIHPEDLFELGLKRYEELASRLDWFDTEYEKAWVINPKIAAIFENPSEDSYKRFEKTYTVNEKVSFEQFQAKFNLAIALCPARPDDYALLDVVIARLKREDFAGLIEWRMFLPPYLEGEMRQQYLNGMLETVARAQTPSLRFLISISIPRDNTISANLYAWLVQWRKSHGELSKFISSIDFCASEYGHEPTAKDEFIKKFHMDFAEGHHHWGLTYHVGEMWNGMSPFTSCRWVTEVSLMGVKRLGHALSLGLKFQDFKDASWVMAGAEWTAFERSYHCHQKLWHENGFDEKHFQELRGLNSSQQDMFYAPKDISKLETLFTGFQKAARGIVKGQKSMIESCPTSNLYMAGFSSIEHHPVKVFADEGLSFCIGSDDPGLFRTSLERELGLTKKLLDWTDDQVKNAQDRAQKIIQNDF